MVVLLIIDEMVQSYFCVNTGTMSGGGSRVCRGKMGSTVITDVDPKAVEEWENQLEKVGETQEINDQYQ